MATDGFVKLPNWLIDDSDLTLHELAVYIVLLRFRNPKTGKCWPGLTTIADLARVSRKTAIRTIKELEERDIIRVERRKELQVNQSNVYEISVANEKPEHIWDRSHRGQRVPQRPLSDESRARLAAAAKKRYPSASEGLGTEEPTTPSASESLPSASGSLPPVPPSPPKKTKVKKTKEQEIRPTFTESGPASDFSFDQAEPISQKQLDYLNDLHVHLTHRPVDNATRERWNKLSQPEIEQLVARYWEQIPRGRGGNWEGVTDDDPAWKHLSAAGRAWYDNGAVPEGSFSWAS